jgi:hypothetical protein
MSALAPFLDEIIIDLAVIRHSFENIMSFSASIVGLDPDMVKSSLSPWIVIAYL